jgi:hypothetical protein
MSKKGIIESMLLLEPLFPTRVGILSWLDVGLTLPLLVTKMGEFDKKKLVRAKKKWRYFKQIYFELLFLGFHFLT